MKDQTPDRAAPLYHVPLIFSISASVLAYEILLMRMLSFEQWQHLVHMVVSMALLGFGASGSFLLLFFEKIRKRLDEWLVFLAGATAVSFPACFSLSRDVGLDPLLLVWQAHQWIAMFVTYVVMSIPFFLAGGAIGIILTASGSRLHRMYAFDLLGAGMGVAAVIPALYLMPPWQLLPVVGLLVLAGASPGCWRMKHRTAGWIVLLISALALVSAGLLQTVQPRIHHTKALPMTLAFPDSRIEARLQGPLGVIHVVGSSLIRIAPGLSLKFGQGQEGEGSRIPEQKAIFLDGDILGPVTRFSGEPRDVEFLDYTTMALPYHVRRPAKALILGSGGGMDVLLSSIHRVREIVALEANSQVATIPARLFAEFAGYLFERPGVNLEIRDARQYLQSNDSLFDLINLSVGGSPTTATGGLHSTGENYLHTIEAFESYLSHLSDSGILALTRWLKYPPRDSLKVMATAISALKKMGIRRNLSMHIIFIRSWKTTTILVSRSPFTPREISRARVFCRDRNFDMVHFHGMGREYANRYDVLEHPYFFEGATALLGPTGEEFIENYLFDIGPATDDRPYFSHFFRWKKLPELYAQLRRELVPMMEMGYFFMLATLAQAALAGAILILAPLFFLRTVHASGRTNQIPGSSEVMGILSYFFSVGAAFMMLEMVLLPKYTLLLSHPVYSAAAVLGTILVLAGFGSMCVRRFQQQSAAHLWVSVGVISIWVVLQIAVGDYVIREAMKGSLWERLLVTVALLSVPSFFLGWPFPSGLRVTADRFPALVPWAWGVNGSASVIGAVLGKCLAVSLGFRTVMLIACALYFLALFCYRRYFRTGGAL
ncbi:MAG: hypothetical protein JRJ29_07300 [Deltaproteobacteria bacterium]|nr:hypothetical protein [Deltaproteobacteria bacterium]